jgi:hypothetical protein
MVASSSVLSNCKNITRSVNLLKNTVFVKQFVFQADTDRKPC